VNLSSSRWQIREAIRHSSSVSRIWTLFFKFFAYVDGILQGYLVCRRHPSTVSRWTKILRTPGWDCTRVPSSAWMTVNNELRGIWEEDETFCSFTKTTKWKMSYVYRLKTHHHHKQKVSRCILVLFIFVPLFWELLHKMSPVLQPSSVSVLVLLVDTYSLWHCFVFCACDWLDLNWTYVILFALSDRACTVT
jgi:hypothetical protein